MKLVILSDYGLDDAAALMQLIEIKSKFTGVDIVAIGGNTSAENSLNNLKKLLANYVGDTVGVRIVDTTSIKQNFSPLPSIHGEDGMGDILADKECHLPILDFKEWLKALDKDIYLVSLGPCTLTVPIMKKVKKCPLLIMAGMNKVMPNYEGMEFNQALDVENYNKTLLYKHKIATLDTCRAETFNLAFADIKGEGLKYDLIRKSVELATLRHPDNCFIYDLIAVTYVTNPEIFDSISVIDPWGNMLSELKVKKGIDFKEYI